MSGPAPCAITFFTDYAAASKREMLLELSDLAQRIAATSGPDKGSLPWLKCARFGDLRTVKGSLRHDANLIAVTGVEADYDGERLSFDEARDRLGAAGLLAILYTSPSHTEDAPRWRVLCPFAAEHAPAERDRFLARLNGLFDGIFSNESWTRSQSYYYGAINGNPSHRVALLDGAPIDLVVELDVFAIGKPDKPKTNGAAHHGPPTPPEAITDKRINGLIQSLLDNIRRAPDGAKYFTLRDISFTVGGYLHLTDWTAEQAVEACVAALPSAQDYAAARRTAAAAIAAGQLKPLPLADRPGHGPQGRSNGSHGPVPGVPPVGEPDKPDDQPDKPDDQPDKPDPEPDEPDGPGDEWLTPEGPEPPPADDRDELGGEDISEQYAMRLFVEANHTELRYNHAANTWLTWAEHFWRLDERQLALSKIMNLSRGLAGTIVGRGALARKRVVLRVTFSSNVERGARAMPSFATAQNDWDADPLLLGTPGGVVDLTTAGLRDGKREDLISRTTSVTPSQMPDCPEWIKFLNYALHDDDNLVRFLQRYFGYCLTGRTNEEVFLFLFGPGGAGKGTMIETVAHVMGDYAGTAPMEVFAATNVRTNAEYYRADLAAKRMVIANEPERGAYWAESFIKETTGGDTISARHPAGRPFRFKPTHKLAMQGNHMPSLRGRSTGMERRLLILPVTRKPRVPDTELKHKLFAEAPGILRWMIEGCLAWQKIGLNPPDSVKSAGEKYFNDQNNFMRWVEEKCVLDPEKSETPTSLRLSFNTWAKLNGESEMDGKAFAEAIDMSDLPLKRFKSGSERRVQGISIKVQTIDEIPPQRHWDTD